MRWLALVNTGLALYWMLQYKRLRRRMSDTHWSLRSEGPTWRVGVDGHDFSTIEEARALLTELVELCSRNGKGAA